MADIKARLWRESALKNIPVTGSFEISPVCNFRCRMCYVRKSYEDIKDDTELKSLDFWLDVAKQAKEAGTVFLLITGGEPFLYPHIRELYESIVKMGMLVSINSNGSCINEETVSWLKELPPQRINITLYGGCNETYEKLCGDKHGFDKVKRGIGLLAENNIRFRFNCSLTPDNAGDFDKILKFASSYDHKVSMATYMFPPVRRTGQYGNFEGRFSAKECAYYQVLTDWNQLSPQQFIITARNAQHYIELTPEMIAEASSKPPRQMSCFSGRSSYWVDWQGNLSGCGMLDHPKFDLTQYSFIDGWKGIVDWTKNIRYSSVCANCVNRSVCFVCISTVYNETGGFDDRPSYLCEKAKWTAFYYKQFSEKIPGELISENTDEETHADVSKDMCQLESDL